LPHSPGLAPPHPECDEPAAHVVEHAPHAVAAGAATNCPLGQFLHVAEPVPSWYWPGMQLVQPCQPATVLNFPTVQSTQVPALPPPQPVWLFPAGQCGLHHMHVSWPV